MIKRPFFGLSTPELRSPVVESRGQDTIEEIPLPRKVTLFLKQTDVRSEDLILKAGDEVKTGQKLRLMEENESYLISTVTGTITGISQHTGYLGRTYPTISIDVTEEDQWSREFNGAGKKSLPETTFKFLSHLPGAPDFGALLNVQPSLNTIIITGIDKDLLVAINQLIVKTEIESLKEGIEYLKKITPGSRIIIVVPPDLRSQVEKSGAEVKVIKAFYPDTLPRMIMKNVLGKVTPPGKNCEDMGVGFINAEAVVALASAFTRGEIPINKILTVVNKDGASVNVRVRIGTHVRDILSALRIETHQGDRLILGGPMTGHAVYSEDTPVLSDTDAILVQDKEQIVWNSDSSCINCGECIRVCPAKIPVNMLVRLLENGLYEEAAEEYDLLYCIECGLCSYVCVARIPVFHYIMLGKYELDRAKVAEESNA